MAGQRLSSPNASGLIVVGPSPSHTRHLVILKANIGALAAPLGSAALARLGGAAPPHMPEAVRAFGISDRPSWLALFSTHPPMEQRIAALRARGG
jgi:hypothetical protein